MVSENPSQRRTVAPPSLAGNFSDAVDEVARLAAVRRYDVLDTPPDGAFERITALAARLFKVPISVVSIVDADRIWFKSHHGLDVAQIQRLPGLCASAILQKEPWVVTNALNDPRALANPLVAGDFGLGFYAGVPLTTQDGHNLGALCVIDYEPREVTDDEMATLRDLAAVVMDELELRLSSQKTIGLEAELRRAAEEVLVSIRDNRQSTEKLEGIQRTLLEHMPDGVVMLGADETIVACNPAAEALLGFRAGELVGCSVGLLRERCLAPNGRPWGPSPTPMMATMRTGVPQRNQIIGVPNPPGAPRWLSLNMFAERDLRGEVNYVVISISDVSTRHSRALVEAYAREESRTRIADILAESAMTMAFQPIVTLDTGRIIGAEALARFPGSRHKTPDLWFAEAAAVGMGAALEVAAIRAALAELERFPPDAYMSVNVSPESITSRELCRLLTGPLAGRVVLELTEHRIVPNYEDLAEALAKLRKAGVLIAVDDTGAGFASLQHILNLRPEIIKLDKALTRAIENDPARRALASSLLRFGAEIGADIVAEGIETEAQLVTLRALGVRYGQGHLLGWPAPLPLSPRSTTRRPVRGSRAARML